MHAYIYTFTTDTDILNLSCKKILRFVNSDHGRVGFRPIILSKFLIYHDIYRKSLTCYTQAYSVKRKSFSCYTTTTHIQYNTGRCLISYNDSRANQRITAYFLYTIKDPFIATRQSSFRKSFHTLLFVFWWTTS